MNTTPAFAASDQGTASPCARCAAVQRTCCQRAEILVTEKDVERIASFLGQTSHSFAEHRQPDDPAYVEFDEDDPSWQQLTVAADGSRRMLRRKLDGSCTFLGAAGCILPLDVRPLVCRLYPWSYDASGLRGVDDEYCPKALLAPDGRPMTEVLGIDEDEAEAWRRQLYEELLDGNP